MNILLRPSPGTPEKSTQDRGSRQLSLWSIASFSTRAGEVSLSLSLSLPLIPRIPGQGPHPTSVCDPVLVCSATKWGLYYCLCYNCDYYHFTEGCECGSVAKRMSHNLKPVFAVVGKPLHCCLLYTSDAADDWLVV